MKIRTDFVTNSSSANYILELQFVTDNAEAEFSLAVSPEVCSSEDGDMCAYNIRLDPNVKRNKVYFADSALSSASSLDALCDLIFSTAYVVGFKSFGDGDADMDDDFDDDYESVSVSAIAPKTIARFKEECKRKEMSRENLKSIIVKNKRYGAGSSSVWIKADNSAFRPFREKYQNASAEEKTAIYNSFIDFVKSEPTLEIQDNSYELPEKMQCAWSSSEEELRDTMKQYLDGELQDCWGDPTDRWMGVYAKVYTIDAERNRMEEKERIYYDNM